MLNLTQINRAECDSILVALWVNSVCDICDSASFWLLSSECVVAPMEWTNSMQKYWGNIWLYFSEHQTQLSQIAFNTKGLLSLGKLSHESSQRSDLNIHLSILNVRIRALRNVPHAFREQSMSANWFVVGN